MNGGSSSTPSRCPNLAPTCSDKCCYTDSRSLTDYRSKCYRVFEGAPGPLSTSDYRAYLVKNADSIMESNRTKAEEVVNPCGLSSADDKPETEMEGFDSFYFSQPQAFLGTTEN